MDAILGLENWFFNTSKLNNVRPELLKIVESPKLENTANRMLQGSRYAVTLGSMVVAPAYVFGIRSIRQVTRPLNRPLLYKRMGFAGVVGCFVGLAGGAIYGAIESRYFDREELTARCIRARKNIYETAINRWVYLFSPIAFACGGAASFTFTHNAMYAIVTFFNVTYPIKQKIGVRHILVRKLIKWGVWDPPEEEEST